MVNAVCHWFMLKTAAILELPRSGNPERDVALAGAAFARSESKTALECFHCGSTCSDREFSIEGKVFCCRGCATVFELLCENGLEGFYDVAKAAGIRGGGVADLSRFEFLDEASVRARLVDFSDDRLTRVTFQLPAIHCIACVWLLENLFRLRSGVGHSIVNFPRKEVSISFDSAKVRLSEVVHALASLGYEPDLRLADLKTLRTPSHNRRLWLQLGVAGFAFGNTMLFSIASYLGLDSASGPGFQRLVGYISLCLALPVVGFSALDYWRASWMSLRQRLLNIDVPIAAGIIALFAQSVYDVFSSRGVGYFDSLAGLLFFLLCGRLFQRKTFDRLAFDRDYRSFFPLSVRRLEAEGERTIALSTLNVGDQLIVRNGELIPADAKLLEGPAMIDYSFVTGESLPVQKSAGDYLYAGGRQMGAAIRVQTVKAVSQGYLTSLWNQDAFKKDSTVDTLQSVTNRYSQRFTKVVFLIAVGSALFWASQGSSLAVKSLISVLIVACPCALALAAPFALGTAQRILGNLKVFLKNPAVLERLSTADTIVFDKTGTLTSSLGSVTFKGSELLAIEKLWIGSLARHSNHPYAVRIREVFSCDASTLPVRRFAEIPGCGMRGYVAGHEVCVGSPNWIRSLRLEGGAVEDSASPHPDWIGADGGVCVAIDGKTRGYCVMATTLRPAIDRLLVDLGKDYRLALLSGDSGRDQELFKCWFEPSEGLHFSQNPVEKLQHIQRLQSSGHAVIMVGDGLNDAGALRQSDVGIAVVENTAAFSPASDIIIDGKVIPYLREITRFAKQTILVVRASFLISALYNILGISIAARGLLEPVVCAILMPLSSVTVVAFACGVTHWLGRRSLLRLHRSAALDGIQKEWALKS